MLAPNRFNCETNGRRMACWQWGDPGALRTIVCVHGLTRNGRDFDFLASALSGNYRVLCPDIVGRGESSWLADPSGYTNPAYIADVAAMLAQLGVTRASWIGTSMGGIMGMMAANAEPSPIEALVLNDIGALIPTAGLSRIRDLADLPTRFSTRASAEATLRKRCESFGITDEAQWQHLIKYGVKEENGVFVFTYDPAIFTSGFSKDTPLADINLWPMWEAVTKIPVLVIRGAHSDLLTRETSLQMQASHPNLQLVEIANTGHAPALMDPAQIEIVRSWLLNRAGL